jgi:hypothetical protein
MIASSNSFLAFSFISSSILLNSSSLPSGFMIIFLSPFGVSSLEIDSGPRVFTVIEFEGGRAPSGLWECFTEDGLESTSGRVFI